MPLKASQMALNLAETSFTYTGEEVNVSFYPDKMNDALLARLDANLEERNASLCELIKSWDVLEDDGSMFPLEPERLAELSTPFKVALVKALVSTVRPNSQPD